jgi:hypothetical protein
VDDADGVASAAEDSEASTALAVTTPRCELSFLGVAVTRARGPCIDARTPLPALGARVTRRRVAAWVAIAVGSLCGIDADAAAAWRVAEARTAFARRARVEEDPRTCDRAGRIDARVRVRSNRACGRAGARSTTLSMEEEVSHFSSPGK